MARQIIWTARAQKDIEEIFQFWNDNNGSATFSQRLHELINSNLEVLRSRPFIGHETVRPNVYVMTAAKFLIYYKIKQDNIFVMHIRDGRRKTYIPKS
ncbi:MAG: type II toxin-antitoxin system RelE/ParE family toxin [Bacteroidetes bacterium]|nr:type II toxin-antitoxin system RelE/ParE family toxin [Bacteroidota bacterium]